MPLLAEDFPEASKNIKGMIRLKETSVILAIDGAKVVGYMVVQYPGGIEYDDGSVSANIRSVAVDSDSRGKGVFKNLLKTAQEYVRKEHPECVRMTAQTITKPKLNRASVGAFTKAGYHVAQFEKKTGEREAYLQFTLPVDRFDDENFKQTAREQGQALLKAVNIEKALMDLPSFTAKAENYPSPPPVASSKGPSNDPAPQNH